MYVFLALGAAAIASLLVALFLGKRDWDGLLLNLGTEMLGAWLTYALFEFFIGRAEKQEEDRAKEADDKARLITQMRSLVRDVAVPAVDELRRRGWLCDGSLRRANLASANLSGARLSNADLSKAVLPAADLSEAQLGKANLREAYLVSANLCGAYLYAANLAGANLTRANLKGARLMKANLEGASLMKANLKGAKVNFRKLTQAKSLAGAILPNGVKLASGD